MVHVAVSVLNADLSDIAGLCTTINTSGADSIQVDVMDGHFVPNLALGPQVCAAFAAHSSLPIEAHLMVEKPERFLATFAEAGATYLIGHVEVLPHPDQFCQAVRRLGKRPGMAINPETSAAMLRPYLSLVDLVIVMGVHPGAGGQEFLPSALTTLRELRQARQGSLPALQLDGGINLRTVAAITAAGADAVVGGSFAVRHPRGIAEAVSALKSQSARSADK
ncbi:MAG: ribulose-phosphate 3-epimerase [Chloroflexi bacterium]|nr:ribulose-phosphate 3-epimerase [Chloroflexota bacterium]